MRRRFLAALLLLCLLVGLMPTSVLAAPAGEGTGLTAEDPLHEATTIYVSDAGDGDGTTAESPTTLEGALEQINAAPLNEGEPQKFVISITEDIERTGTTDYYFKQHIVSILGNGHTVRSSGSLGAVDGAVLHLGKEDGSDRLILKEMIRAQAHSVVSAGNNTTSGTVHMYDGVSVLGADDAFTNDSSGHGISAGKGVFYLHGGEISGFCIPQPGAGVLITYGGRFYMDGGKITNCESRGGTQFGGGAIFADGGNGICEIHITGGELSNNRADNRGGAIATQSDVLIEISGNVRIVDNHANRGGAISVQNSAVLHMEGDILFENNTCNGNGGAISALSGCEVTIDGAQFTNNRSETGYGGAIYHQGSTSGENQKLIITNTAFAENQAAYGGAILSLGGLGSTNDMTAVLTECSFTGNSAHCYEAENDDGEMETDGGYGGAVYVQDVKLTIDASAIENNSSEDSGGGVYFTGTNPDLMALNINGSVKIFDNAAPKANNLYLRNLTPPENPEPGDLTEEYQTKLTVSGPLSNGTQNAEIGIYMDKPGVFTQNYKQYCDGIDPKGYFICDDPVNYHVQITEDQSEAMLAAGPTEYTITASAGENGAISPSGAVSVAAGTDQTFTISPDSGYHILDVLVDGQSVGAVSEYTFKKVTMGHTIEAVFEQDSSSVTRYTIQAEAGEGGSISPAGSVRVVRGGDKTFTIRANEGYEIADVLVDGQSMGAVDKYIFENVRSAHTIEVFFDKTAQIVDPDDNGVSDWLNTKDHDAYLKGYGNGSFGPADNMTRAEVAQMFYNLLNDKDVAVTVSFADVPEDAWYREAVETLATLGIVEGIGNDQFAPERTITRAEFTVIAMRFTNGALEGENIFSDVSEDQWFYDQVVGSIQYGWITGYTDGTFRPYNTIARSEVTAITNRMLGRFADEAFVDGHAEQLRQFPDVSKDIWGYYEIMEATNTHDYNKNGSGETWTDLG